MARTLFASDVHLRASSPAANRPFLRFLEEPCEALYILGDLFDYWIGPKHLASADYREEIAALREKSARSKVFFIHGNRDYLAEGRFARATGVTILGDRARIELGGRVVLLAHGDFIYNTNPKYAAYRTLMRSKPIADLWLALPAFAGRTLVRGFRKVSKRTTPAYAWKPESLLARARPLFEQGADAFICGHIHLPQHLECEVAGRKRDVFILGDWEGGTQDVVEHDAAGFRFYPWSGLRP
jgi:UDP-2,3-diacylglucosamine hydrolase